MTSRLYLANCFWKRSSRERDLARQERDLLKKALAFFARESR